MRRVNLVEATMQAWARLNPSQRQRFFEAFVKAALRLDRLQFRAWLLRRLRNPPLAAPVDLTRFAISDSDMAALLKQLGRMRRPPNPDTLHPSPQAAMRIG